MNELCSILQFDLTAALDSFDLVTCRAVRFAPAKNIRDTNPSKVKKYFLTLPHALKKKGLKKNCGLKNGLCENTKFRYDK